MRTVRALTHFPPGLLPLIASFLGADSFFIVGGDNCGIISRSVFCYSLDTRTWRTNAQPMNFGRVAPTAVAIGSRMLVCGGISSDHHVLDTCEAFDPTINEWSAMPALSTPRYGACAVEWKGCAFVFGGWNTANSRSLSTAECFDPRLNRWFALAPMAAARQFPVAVAVSGCGILVMGGFDSIRVLQSAELYDPTTNQWTAMTWQLPQPLCEFAAACIDGVLHIIAGNSAGRDPGNEPGWSMKLDTQVPVWSTLPPMPSLK